VLLSDARLCDWNRHAKAVPAVTNLSVFNVAQSRSSKSFWVQFQRAGTPSEEIGRLCRWRVMAAFLKLALLVTGVGSLLVWAMPDLIVIGFILLILPGLILSLMPTVFMYLAFFFSGVVRVEKQRRNTGDCGWAGGCRAGWGWCAHLFQLADEAVPD